jgi:hypothetical protein
MKMYTATRHCDVCGKTRDISGNYVPLSKDPKDPPGVRIGRGLCGCPNTELDNLDMRALRDAALAEERLERKPKSRLK